MQPNAPLDYATGIEHQFQIMTMPGGNRGRLDIYIVEYCITKHGYDLLGYTCLHTHI